MRKIKKVFGSNLKRLRAERTQAQMAELLGLPIVSYQRLEYGQFPQDATLDAITDKLKVSETELFQDPDLAQKAPPGIEALTEVIREHREKLATLEKQLKKRDAEISALKKRISELEHPPMLKAAENHDDLLEWVKGLSEVERRDLENYRETMGSSGKTREKVKLQKKQ